MQGTIVKITVEEGHIVEAGQLVVVLEAMKMEQPITAHKAGVVAGLQAEIGQTVTSGAVLLEVKDHSGDAEAATAVNVAPAKDAPAQLLIEFPEPYPARSLTMLAIPPEDVPNFAPGASFTLEASDDGESFRPVAEVALAALGPDAGLIGVADLARRAAAGGRAG